MQIDEIPRGLVFNMGENQYRSLLLNMIEKKVASQEQIEAMASEEMLAEFVEKKRGEWNGNDTVRESGIVV